VLLARRGLDLLCELGPSRHQGRRVLSRVERNRRSRHLLGDYSSGTIPIVQYNERIRWLSFDDPPPELLEQRALYVVEAERDEASKLAPRFQEFAKVGEIARTRGGRTITRYIIYTAAKPAQPVLDR